MSSRQRYLNVNPHHSGIYASAWRAVSQNRTTDKVRSIGQCEINGTPLPVKGFF
jgi:hypothetical protein